MIQKGVILPESVISGNVYGSLQGGYIKDPPGGEDAVQVVVYTLANFIEDEMPRYKAEKSFEDEMEKIFFNQKLKILLNWVKFLKKHLKALYQSMDFQHAVFIVIIIRIFIYEDYKKFLLK